jgi:ribonucleotide monophosphatase NagD (HAD superfamily)
LGLWASNQDADRVLLCRDLSFAIPDLERLADLVHRGARLWVSNTDVTHPSFEGHPVPETGALLAALQAVTGPVAFDCIGKPNPHMARIAMESAGIAPQDAIFVGDSSATDGALAKSMGMPFVHVVREGRA